MSIISQVSDTMQAVLTTSVEAAAATLAYVKCADRAKFTPSPLVQTVVYDWPTSPPASGN